MGERVRPTVARVDLGSLKANYRAIVEHLARERPAAAPGVIAVVKANAYGHGAAQVGRALEDAGADLLACADIEEGAALRTAGVRAEILIFGALSVSDLEGLFDCRLTPTIEKTFQIMGLAQYARIFPSPEPALAWLRGGAE